MLCKYCKGNSVKNGIHRGIQRYKCKKCNRVFQSEYRYKAYEPQTDNDIVRYLKEGCGIRSIARLCYISPTTTMSRILRIAKGIQRPFIVKGKEYEIDEMCTFVGSKNRRRWICYALRKDTREVVSYVVGGRSKKSINQVVGSIECSEAKTVYTDGYVLYKQLLKSSNHIVKKGKINHIERKNLSLRTHLKRLNRKTICFSRSLIMLDACLRIYFWS